MVCYELNGCSLDIMYKTPLLVALVLWFVTIANATAKPNEVDLPIRSGHYYISYVLNEDATSVETREWSRTVLKATAIAWAKEASVSYSTSMQKAEIIDAYTQKSDGRRINVPEGNYQFSTNKGRDQDSPIFADDSSIAVVFPDVAVGDTVVFAYRITEKEAVFPHHFSVAETFPKQAPYDDVRIRIDYPESLWVQYQGHGLKETISTPTSGRKLIEWTYANPNPYQDDRHDFSAYNPDLENGYAFSTFKTYAQIATAYGERVKTKVDVTPRLRNLAEQITEGKTRPQEQAQAIYEWVATQISYGGNCVGLGSVVPHNIDFILTNKMGDCKDHATLLQALLSARGIRSTQALINAGSIYVLPKIPVVSSVNHVINYLPDFDLYLDSTSNSTPFGMLPLGDRGKPVLFVENFKDGAMTPTPRCAQNQILVSTLKIKQDGSISGSIDATLKGDAAVTVREWARKLSHNDEEDFVKNVFRAAGVNATGKLIKDDPSPLTDSYHFRIIISRAEKFLKSLHGGAFSLYPILAGRGIRGMVPTGSEQEIPYDVACSSGAATESYVIELPKGMKVLRIPKNIKASNSVQSYQATYYLKHGVLIAQRNFEDHTPTSVCSPDISAEYAQLGSKITDNLLEQVIYK